MAIYWRCYLPAERIKLYANEIKPRLQRLKREALKIEPKLVVRINTIGATLSKFKDELLDKKQFLIEFINEFYYDIQTYLYDIKPRLNLSQEEITKFLKEKNLSVTEWYWYSEILPMWFSLQDPKFSNWIEKLLLEQYTGNDQALISALTQKINAKSDGSASHRYILDLSMATDLLG
ncbi:hypothetical protein [Amazonocrinis nigriterrae]|uniref:hypothetical protein n=1 Tax=Amazonocrinis nigriterrae TaxID=2840443 RepID=UPI001CED7047|nr:hypothetical protein [Amazonocrinis nigriterrae]